MLKRGDAVGAVAALIRAADLHHNDEQRWDEAHDLAIAGLRLCDSYGYGLPTWFLQLGQALVAADRADEDLVRRSPSR